MAYTSKKLSDIQVMSWYRKCRPFLFAMAPERAHHVSLAFAKRLCQHGLLLKPAMPSMPLTSMGMDFTHPIGLAAGLDKNAEYLDLWAHMGFAFIEVGTVTPKPQPGNMKPRLFRLPAQAALINRMGFNNKGVEYLLRQVERSHYKGILGINIGKNATTPFHEALSDYQAAFEAVYPMASYITVNISSPNTQGLRDLQHGEALQHLLEGLKATQAHCQSRWQRYVPMWVKVSPDLSPMESERMASMLLKYQVDAIVVSNTTLQRPDSIQGLQYAAEQGGLSGRPLKPIAQAAMARWKALTGGAVPLVGVGGIDGAQAARDRLDAGATLLQLYTALIYEGPDFLSELLTSLDGRWV